MGFRRSLVRIQSPRHKPQGAKQQQVAANLAASFLPPLKWAGQASRAGLTPKKPLPADTGRGWVNRPGTPLWFSTAKVRRFSRESAKALVPQIQERLVRRDRRPAAAPRKAPRRRSAAKEKPPHQTLERPAGDPGRVPKASGRPRP